MIQYFKKSNTKKNQLFAIVFRKIQSLTQYTQYPDDFNPRNFKKQL